MVRISAARSYQCFASPTSLVTMVPSSYLPPLVKCNNRISAVPWIRLSKRGGMGLNGFAYIEIAIAQREELHSPPKNLDLKVKWPGRS